MAVRFSFSGLALMTFIASVCAYVPASPTNSTSEAVAGGLNMTDISKLNLQWFSDGSYSENVSYQLVGNGSQGISKGPLMHFSEKKVNNQTALVPTTTPWIALVSCDFNATNASQDDDIFTLARDNGAIAALLYSLYSAACIINPEYADPATFDQVFDIFSTQTLASARLIESQFSQFVGLNQTIHGSYDSKWLNDSAVMMNMTIERGRPVASGYIYAVLQAYNATVDPVNNTTPGEIPSSPNSSSGHSPNTGLAMIILYTITGCVSALFCVVIISGAIRAIRHPERYGPRRNGGAGGLGQSRARGLTRAILDTFPVVKFGDNTQNAKEISGQNAAKDMEAQSRSDYSDPNTTTMEMNEWEIVNRDGHHDLSSRVVGLDEDVGSHSNQPPMGVVSHIIHSSDQRDLGRRSDGNTPEANAIDPQPQPRDRGEGTSQQLPSGNANVVVPEAFGRETCPICIVDFEEGDDLRLLPCEGKHRFHQHCVDPWLLELSSSCPICRQDFLALETMISGESGDGDHHPSTHPGSPAIHNRFSRYLRFANRRRNEVQDRHDPADPYMPTAAETSMYSGI